MRKIFLTSGLLMGIVFLNSCAHQTPTPASQPTPTAPSKINLGAFVDPNNTQPVACGLVDNQASLPGNVSYVTFLKNNLMSELNKHNKYDPNSRVSVDATLNTLSYDSSVFGGGDWKIQMTFNDHIQQPYTISSMYHFSGSAGIPCVQVMHAFVPAAKQFMQIVYNNANFKNTLQGK